MRKTILVIFLSVFAISFALADSQHHLSIGLVHSNLYIPFAGNYPLIPVHPGINVVGEKTWKDWGAVSLYQDMNLIYIRHSASLQSVNVKTDAGFRFRIRNLFWSDIQLGIGYSQLIRRDTFSSSTEGTPILREFSLLPALGAALGVSIGIDITPKFGIRLGWQSLIHYYGFMDMAYLLPFMPYGLLEIAFRYAL